MTWADSSFIIALYVGEEHSPTAESYFAANPLPITITAFSILEVQHALRLAAFRGEISESQLVRSLLRLEHDLGEGFYERIEIHFDALVRRASQISHRHTVASGIRFIDLLHIASALEAKCHRFLTFDKRQGRLAKSAGLEVRP